MSKGFNMTGWRLGSSWQPADREGVRRLKDNTDPPVPRDPEAPHRATAPTGARSPPNIRGEWITSCSAEQMASTKKPRGSFFL
jgi:hypothetical protein